MENLASTARLFEGVVFSIIESDDLDEQQFTDIHDVLVDRGAHHIAFAAYDLEQLKDVTHIITTHIDFPNYEKAIEYGIQVVKPRWVSQSIAKRKVCNPRQFSPDPSQYFHDVVICCANLPEGDKDAIEAGCMALGGQYSIPLNKLTTHIITNDLKHEKCVIAKEKGLRCKIVLPHWFDDCLRLGKMINEGPYQFPNPEILKQPNSDPVRIRPSPYIEGATSAKPSGDPIYTPPSSPSQSRKDLNVFMAKKILLSPDLNLGEHLHQTLDRMISYAGGTLTTSIGEADIYIGQYRFGNAYVKASQAGKLVANLSWLYHVLNTNRWTNPTFKLLFYPLPKGGIPGFEGMRISISNYTGNARAYLENLITACGAQFTKTMKQDNTHLITAHRNSEKCDAAQEWNINIVNHLWLEDSYAKCMVQSLTNSRYTHFPPRTNLGEVAGMASLDMKMVERDYFPKPRHPSASASVSPSKQLPQRPSPRKTVGTPSAQLLGSAKAEKKADDALRADDNDLAMLQDQDPSPEPQTVKKRGRSSKASLATPRLIADQNKENESPLLPSTGRASKNKALHALHDAAADIEQFQREMKRKGGVTHGRDRRHSHASELVSEPSHSPAPQEQKRGKKRVSDEATYDVTAEGSDLSDGETQVQPRPLKKGKTAATTEPQALPEVKYKMMVTGEERWRDNLNKESADKNKLRLLGVQLVTDPRDVDILVAPKILRTRKFVSALAFAPAVVDSKYLDSTLRKNKLPDESMDLVDKDGEEQYGFKLSEALTRAEINKQQLLRGWTIHVTKDIPGGFDTYNEIITVNGGTALMYQGRTGVKLQPRKAPSDDDEAGDESQHQGGESELDCAYLVSGPSAAEAKLWKTFRDLAKKQGVTGRVVKQDWLLNAAMSQMVTWDEKWSLPSAE